MKTIHLTSGLDDEWLASQRGLYFDQRHFDWVLPRTACDVIEPNGDVLLKYRPRVLSKQMCEECRPGLRKAGERYSHKRGYHSGIFGYYDEPDCRPTAFSLQELDAYAGCLRFARAVDRIFEREMPDAHARQQAAALAASPWSLHGLAFSTGTANLWTPDHDARTPLHIDKRDYRDGFGVISVLRQGNYTGGHLIFAKYRLAVDLRTADVLLCDVHEYHANAPIPEPDGWERLAVILYFLENLSSCGDGG